MRKLFLAATAISLTIAGTACTKQAASTTPKATPDAKPADTVPEVPKAEVPPEDTKPEETKPEAPATP